MVSVRGVVGVLGLVGDTNRRAVDRARVDATAGESGRLEIRAHGRAYGRALGRVRLHSLTAQVLRKNKKFLINEKRKRFFNYVLLMKFN